MKKELFILTNQEEKEEELPEEKIPGGEEEKPGEKLPEEKIPGGEEEEEEKEELSPAEEKE